MSEWWTSRSRRDRRSLRRLDKARHDMPPRSVEPPSIEELAANLRRLEMNRLSGLTTESSEWSAAILDAYDENLVQASRSLGLDEHLTQLDGMDRELERVRLEVALQDAGLTTRSSTSRSSEPDAEPETETEPRLAEPPPDAAPATAERPPAEAETPPAKAETPPAEAETPPAEAETPPAKPAPAPAEAATRLIDTVIHILPAGHRERYAEEFAGELFELAAHGMSRWRQMLFVLRLLDRAWVLRAELAPPKQAPN